MTVQRLCEANFIPYHENDRMNISKILEKISYHDALTKDEDKKNKFIIL